MGKSKMHSHRPRTAKVWPWIKVLSLFTFWFLIIFSWSLHYNSIQSISSKAWCHSSFLWTLAISSRQLRYAQEWLRVVSCPWLPSISWSKYWRTKQSTKTVIFSKTYLPCSCVPQLQWGSFSWESFRCCQFQSHKWEIAYRHFWRIFIKYGRTLWQTFGLLGQFFSGKYGLSCKVRGEATVHRVWVFCRG